MTTTRKPTEDFQASEVELVYRSKVSSADMPVINNSQAAYKILKSSWDDDRIEFIEQFKILLVNRRNACLGVMMLGTGGTSYCVVDPRLAFMAALKANASGIILAHNHPSGNLNHSEADLSLTRQFAKAGQFLGIKVFDHLIVTRDGYTSFADNGLMPDPA